MRRVLFWLSRTRQLGWVVRLVFSRFWWLLPVRRVSEIASVFVFEHPAPTWQPHLLLVPKRAIRSLMLARETHARLFGEIVRLAFGVAVRRKLEAGGFALLVNGGTYQDVPQLHVHLAGLDDGLRYTVPGTTMGPSLAQTAMLRAFAHPDPQRRVHLVIVPAGRLAWLDLAGPTGERIGHDLLMLTQELVARFHVGTAGFTLLASVPPGGIDGPVCFHLVAGDRTTLAGNPSCHPEELMGLSARQRQ